MKDAFSYVEGLHLHADHANACSRDREYNRVRKCTTSCMKMHNIEPMRTNQMSFGIVLVRILRKLVHIDLVARVLFGAILSILSARGANIDRVY